MNNYTDALKKMSNEELLKEFVLVNTNDTEEEEVKSDLTEEMVFECRTEVLLRMQEE